jgi:hypothetical protein
MPTEGAHDGTVFGKEYFTCPKRHGVFLKAVRTGSVPVANADQPRALFAGGAAADGLRSAAAPSGPRALQQHGRAFHHRG